jgi:hypothetical protein
MWITASSAAKPKWRDDIRADEGGADGDEIHAH